MRQAIINLIRCPVVKRRMTSLHVVVADPLAQPVAQLRSAFKSVQVQIMVFDRPPQSFNEYVVLASATAIHADGNPVVLERLGEIVAGKLCPLVRVEDLRHTISAQRLIEGMYAEIRLQGMGKPPGQDSTTVPVHDNAKIHKSPGHGAIGVSSPEESHLQALSEPGVNLSAHRAPIVPVDGTKPARQCGNKNL